MTHNFKRIAILKGGWSNEREVSLTTGDAFEHALRNTLYDVAVIDVKKDLNSFLTQLNFHKPDVIINALHGTGGEDGTIQGVLTMLDIPYTHSSVVSSAVAMDKMLSKNIFQQSGIPIANFLVMPQEEYKLVSTPHPFDFPYVIKPITEGSSRGVSIIKSDLDKQSAMKAWVFGDEIMIEEYIPGREIQVAVINGKALGAIEIKPHNNFYDYEAKYTDGKATHIMPAVLSTDLQTLLFKYAELAHKCLKCDGITRVDFRVDESNSTGKVIVILEVNTQPGMTPLSLVPEIAAYYGISFLDLIEIMLKATYAKFYKKTNIYDENQSYNLKSCL